MIPGPSRGFSRALAAILIAAALSRFAFGAWVVGFGAATKGDEVDYHAIATHLAAGGGFVSAEETPTARRPPAYPVLLSVLYRVSGPDAAAGRVAQVVLGVAVVWLTVLVARRWFGAAVGMVAGGFAALNPFLIFISGYLLTENLYLVFLLSALVIGPTPGVIATGSRARILATGVLLGLATLARPTGVPMLEWTVAAALLFGGAPWPRRVGRVGLMLAAFLLVVTPWLARNARVVGGWVLTTHGGITFYQGNNAKVAHTPQWHGGAAPLGALPRIEELTAMDELARDRLAWQLGRDYLRANVGDVPGLVGWKLARFWRLKSDMGLSGIRSGWWFNRESPLGRIATGLDVGMAYAVVSLPLFVLGLVTTRRRWRDLLLAYGVIAVHTAVAVVFFGSLRTRIPIEPVICVFAAAALVAVAPRLRRDSHPRAAVD